MTRNPTNRHAAGAALLAVAPSMRRQGRGHARSSEEYLRCVDRLEQDVAEAEARLQAARGAARVARMR